MAVSFQSKEEAPSWDEAGWVSWAVGLARSWVGAEEGWQGPGTAGSCGKADLWGSVQHLPCLLATSQPRAQTLQSRGGGAWGCSPLLSSGLFSKI